AHVPYPINFRTWAVARTMLVGPQSPSFAARGGFHHYYANDQAMEGYRTGKFPDGSIIVDEGVATTQRNGNTIETGRRSLDVMHKDSKMYAATGGWGYDHFDGEKQVSEATPAVRNECFTVIRRRRTPTASTRYSGNRDRRRASNLANRADASREVLVVI